MPQLITLDQAEISNLSWIEAVWKQPIQRIFWLYGVPEHGARGGHCHQTCQMVLHCVTGSVDVYVQTTEQDYLYTLSSENDYLFLAPTDWRLMQHFSADAVLVVFAD